MSRQLLLLKEAVTASSCVICHYRVANIAFSLPWDLPLFTQSLSGLLSTKMYCDCLDKLFLQSLLLAGGGVLLWDLMKMIERTLPPHNSPGGFMD